MKRNEIYYHVCFETIEHQFFFRDSAIRLAIENFIKGWLDALGIHCQIVRCQSNHVHLMVSAQKANWNSIMCELQKALTKMLQTEFQGMPKYIWVYDWWFRRIRTGDEIKVYNYIASQNLHHHSM